MSLCPIRLPPGADIRRALESQAGLADGVSGFVVTGIGSLQNPRLRFAGEADELTLSGPYEVLSLAGTVTRDGAHLHMAISDSAGQVVGGHVCYGNTVRTTMEVLLMQTPEWELGREIDTATGFTELVVKRGRSDTADAH